ncbi:putative membrane protein YqiK [Leifsonia shinshuensis]|uniref:Putative membrane protein YqiK n=1 Tax=Leifsonia shinshuensis TaxID=150026 RepID=A0A853CVA5_9MICO|nr:putative membrane protein YqiK [Leifsonia shinshuensis]
MALTGTMPSWVPLAILAVLVVIGVVIALVRTRARRS